MKGWMQPPDGTVQIHNWPQEHGNDYIGTQIISIIDGNILHLLCMKTKRLIWWLRTRFLGCFLITVEVCQCKWLSSLYRRLPFKTGSATCLCVCVLVSVCVKPKPTDCFGLTDVHYLMCTVSNYKPDMLEQASYSNPMPHQVYLISYTDHYEKMQTHCSLKPIQFTPSKNSHLLSSSLHPFLFSFLSFKSSAAAAAPSSSFLLLSPSPKSHCVLRASRLAQHQGFLRLELVRHSHEDSLHMVVVATVAVSAAVSVARILGWRLKQRHGVRVGKLLCRLGAHLGCVAKVTLVAHQDARHLLPQRVLLALLNPRRKASEAGGVSDVVDKDDSVYVPVVVLDHALPEALLTCSVPQLHLQEMSMMKKDNRTRDRTGLRRANTLLLMQKI